MNEYIDSLVAHINAVIKMHWTSDNFPAPIVKAEYGPKWAKIFKWEMRNNVLTQTSIYCFVALETFTNKALGQVNMGDIMKAASTQAPAKHARGNVLTGDLACCGQYGIAYLR